MTTDPMQPEELEEALAPAPESELDGLIADRDSWKDKALRLTAEMENLRKRTSKELQDARTYAVANFAREVLTVADNLERALAAEAKDAEQLKTGVQMVGDGLISVLAKFNVTKFNSVGEPLDPNKHQVMVEIDSEEPAGTVVQEMQPGYTIGDRLLRPALVGTAKQQTN